jgi:hypothetical protein
MKARTVDVRTAMLSKDTRIGGRAAVEEKPETQPRATGFEREEKIGGHPKSKMEEEIERHSDNFEEQRPSRRQAFLG